MKDLAQIALQIVPPCAVILAFIGMILLIEGELWGAILVIVAAGLALVALLKYLGEQKQINRQASE